VTCFRNLFGWKIVSVNQTGYPGASDRGFSLHSRSDLLLDARLEEMPFTEVRQALDSLYPKASIIILTYNNLDYTRQCLESISAKTAYPSYEIIIVDNASTDGTVEFLQDYAASHPNFQLVLNGENRGFATGNNQGIAASTGEYIVFLNNDTVVTQGWLSGLISHMRDPAVGAVGPVTNSAGNESKIGADYSEISGLDNFARRYRQAHAGDSFEIRMLALFCMLVRRSVIDQVGLLDERFEVGMYEDDDFSLRIRQKGFRILCAEDVYIHHWGSVSFSQLEAERYQRLHLENRKKFEEKWGTEWQPHRWRMDEV
jgi:GT2 family glycosyltransferase